MAIRVEYKLSQAGQKASLAQGGDGQQFQTVTLVPPFAPEVIEAAELDPHGNGKVNLRNAELYNTDLWGNDAAVCGEAANGKTVRSVGVNTQYQRISLCGDWIGFDAPLSEEQVIAAVGQMLADRQGVQAQITRPREVAEAESRAHAEMMLPQCIAQYEAEVDDKRKAAELRAQNEAEEERKKEAREREQQEWIEQYGSPRLRKAVAASYNCQRLYVTERAAVEYPSFIVDFDDEADWKERRGPSEVALDLAAQYEKASVVWLTHPVCWPDEEWQPREAVVLRGFLGKYDLVQEL